FLFKAFFPQLIAGPIVRPNQTLPQIQRIFDDKWRRHRLLVFGLSLIVLGLIKKVVLADSLAPVVDDIFYVRPDSAYLAWLGAVLFLFQIYFDFSGYSDIAIGSAYLLGIRLPRNFATPFLAPSIQQLWQRWHITLTLFLRDYLFLPLADMRVVTRRYRVIQHFCAIVLTMTFCGLWHGAGWNFVLWGALQGVAMVFAALWSRYLPSPPAPVGWAATITFFVVTLVFFRSPNLGYAFNYLDTMLSFRGGWPAAVDDAAPPWEVVAGVVGLFALHWIEFRLQQPDVLLIMRRAEGPVSRGFLSGVALFFILIPVPNVTPFFFFRFLPRRHVFLPFVPEGLSFCPLSLRRDAGITGGGFWTAIDRGDAAVANPACGAAHSRPTRQGFRFRINSWWSPHLDDRTRAAPTTELTGPTRRRA